MWTFQPCCSGAGLCAVVEGVEPDCGREAFLLPDTERSEIRPNMSDSLSPKSFVACGTDFVAFGSS